MATFQFGVGPTTVTFRLLLAQPEQSREAQVSVRHIPGGDTNYVDIGGKMPTVIRGEGKFDTFADFVTMRDNVGVSGTLAYSEATYTVYLTKVSRQKVPNNRGDQVAALEFLISQ